MMQGVVNQRCEATLPLVVGNAIGQSQVIDGDQNSMTLFSLVPIPEMSR